MTIPYTKNTTWADNAGGGTPITAAKLNNVEDGIFNAHQAPAVRVTHNAAQSIAHNTETTLAFNTERFDTAGGAASTMHDTVTNNSRLTAVYAGKYLITANCEWAGTVTTAYIILRLNGSTIIAKHWPGGINYLVMHVSTIYDLAVNDYVEVRVIQTNGGSTALNISSAGNYSPEFMMVRVA